MWKWNCRYICSRYFIGFGGSNVYRPNTLTYSFPEIISQKIIIAPHTFYKTNTTLLDAVASPLVTAFTDTFNVKYVQPTVEQLSFGKAHILAGGMLILSFIILLTLFYFNKRTVVRVK